jgi:selenide,water dikinase
VEDDEPKFGLSVVGVVHPDKYWTNGGAQPGDALILTKPLGSGVLFNANLKGWVSEKAMAECIEALICLNRSAAKAMQAFDIHAATDITGFGLSGHALEMAKASQVAVHIRMDDLPVMDEALEMYRKGMNTGVNEFNQNLVTDHLHFEKKYPHWHRQIIYDPQTSGGLLAAVPADQAPDLISALKQAGTPAASLVGAVHALKGATHLIFT